MKLYPTLKDEPLIITKNEVEGFAAYIGSVRCHKNDEETKKSWIVALLAGRVMYEGHPVKVI